MSIIWGLKYLCLTIKHKWYVGLAGLKVGVPVWRLIVHDWTKFLPCELPAYGRQFFGDKGDPYGFAKAWAHHQNYNPHHWEYWIPRTAHNKSGYPDNVPLPMPETYVREMVADWMGASKAYTGSWDMNEWLDKNLLKMVLHGDTITVLRDVLISLNEDYHRHTWQLTA